jgi:hypothetical protein
MGKRSIERRIRKKVNDWLSSIEDGALRDFLGDKIIVTGGSIASLLLGEGVNDYDVYLRDKEACKRVALYYVEQFKKLRVMHVGYGWTAPVDNQIKVIEKDERISIMVKSEGVASAAEGEKDETYQFFELITNEEEQADTVEGFVAACMQVEEPESEDERLPPYSPLFMTSNAITLTDEIQVVLRFYGEPKTIHQNFDFEHCKCYWASWRKRGRQLFLRKSSLELLLERRLRYTGSKYPICSLFRLRKFMSRGWYYPYGEVLKIAFQVQDLDLKDPEVLQDQLIGMDVAYFLEVIRKIKEDGVKSVDGAYLIQLIDELH